MRELKFRAYDPEYKKMSVYFKGITPGGDYMFFPESGNLDVTIEATKSRCTVMQWTGLIDKKGTDIYEGDIVKFSDKFIGVIYYDETIAAFVTKSPLAKNGTRSLHTNKTKYGVHIVEVLGCVYENPEPSK